MPAINLLGALNIYGVCIEGKSNALIVETRYNISLQLNLSYPLFDCQKGLRFLPTRNALQKYRMRNVLVLVSCRAIPPLEQFQSESSDYEHAFAFLVVGDPVVHGR